jgi:hypothetical protein
VVASDDQSGKTLWDIKVFEVQIDPKHGEDGQWVFITAPMLVGNALRIKDEESRCHKVDLTTKSDHQESEKANLLLVTEVQLLQTLICVV